jgi:glutaredoxin
VVLDQFDGVDAQVLGVSVDSKHCLNAWAESLGGITYPLLADFWPHGAVAQAYGVLRSEGYSERAIFIIDKSGIIRYVDVHNIDEQPNNDVLFAELNKLEPEAAARWAAKQAAAEAVVKAAASQSKPASAPGDGADVIMYCTQWCPACRRARAWLQQHDVPYKEIDIARDRQAAAYVRSVAKGLETTPTFVIKGKVIVNFWPADIAKLLGIEE